MRGGDKKYEAKPKPDGEKWRSAVEVSIDHGSWRSKERTIEGEGTFENPDDAMKESLKLLREITG